MIQRGIEGRLIDINADPHDAIPERVRVKGTLQEDPAALLSPNLHIVRPFARCRQSRQLGNRAGDCRRGRDTQNPCVGSHNRRTEENGEQKACFRLRNPCSTEPSASRSLMVRDDNDALFRPSLRKSSCARVRGVDRIETVNLAAEYFSLKSIKYGFFCDHQPRITLSDRRSEPGGNFL